MDFINSDRSLKVGDLVFQSYKKSNILYRITKLERRFLDQDDLRYGVYEDGKVGDEYDPIVTIEAVANLDLRFNPSDKLRKDIRELDASYLTRVDPKYLKDYKKRLTKIIGEFWK